jgi:hypothetical protein
MAAFSGPGLVTNGLILNLDVASRKSYLRSVPTSLINTNAWAVGQTDSVAGYSANGSVGENGRISGTDPWGNTSTLWETRPNGDNQSDGGWNTSVVSIDRTKLYRFSVWVRRTSASSGGTFYLGTGSDGGVFSTQDGLQKGNPYWDCVGAGSLVQNQWYLVCGHIYPSNTTYTGNHPNTGYFLPGSTTKVGNVNFCNIVSDLKWGPTSTWGQHRCYLYYCSDNTTRLNFADPRIDLCDGNEPTISDLVNKGVTTIMDDSGLNNHHRLFNGYIPTTDAPTKFQLDGTNHGFVRDGALNGVTNNCTVVIYYKTTDTQELWVRGNQNNGLYLSASASNNYYHGSAGSPTNFVDLATVIRPDSPVNYRNGAYHMWEAKGVDFSGWTYFDWFLYPSGWQLAGDVSKVLVYNRSLTAEESAQNFNALRGRFNI